jgi:hypothetical protein
MQILETLESNTKEVKDIEFDCLICSSGFEERAIYVSKTIKFQVKRKIVVGFKNYENEGFRETNDSFYNTNGFEFILENADEADKIITKLKELFADANTKIKIAIDYSSMTRVWYSAILNFFDSLNYADNVDLFFFYSFSKFSQPVNGDVRNIHIGPIKNYSSLSIPDKPTALIIGLGYEKERAFGLTEYFDAETYLFVADKSKGEDYFNSVQDANIGLLSSAKPENIFEYSLQYLNYSESLLYAVCKSLKSDYRLVLAPTGPKPFSLLCLLTSIRLKNIDVWRISAGHFSRPSRKEPEGSISVYKVSFI